MNISQAIEQVAAALQLSPACLTVTGSRRFGPHARHSFMDDERDLDASADLDIVIPTTNAWRTVAMVFAMTTEGWVVGKHPNAIEHYDEDGWCNLVARKDGAVVNLIIKTPREAFGWRFASDVMDLVWRANPQAFADKVVRVNTFRALREKVGSMDHHGTVEELRIERGRGYSEV